MSDLRGSLGFKGERGYSAYEIAVQNGFVGTEQDWLAQLGTSTHFTQISTSYTTEAEESSHDLPDDYTSNSFLDVYVNGKHLTQNEYTIENGKVNFTPSLSASSVVEMCVTTATTNSLPIVTTIDENSTDDTASSAKAVYLIMQNLENEKMNKSESLFFRVEEDE